MILNAFHIVSPFLGLSTDNRAGNQGACAPLKYYPIEDRTVTRLSFTMSAASIALTV